MFVIWLIISLNELNLLQKSGALSSNFFQTYCSWILHNIFLLAQSDKIVINCISPRMCFRWSLMYYCIRTLTRNSNIDQKLVNSLHRLLNCEKGGLDWHVITTKYRTRVHCIHMYHLFFHCIGPCYLFRSFRSIFVYNTNKAKLPLFKVLRECPLMI